MQPISPDTKLAALDDKGKPHYTKEEFKEWHANGAQISNSAIIVKVFSDDPSKTIPEIAKITGLTEEQVNSVITTDLASQFWQDVRKHWILTIAKLVPSAIKCLEDFAVLNAPRSSKLKAATSILNAVGVDTEDMPKKLRNKDKIEKPKTVPSVIINIQKDKVEPKIINSEVK